MPDAGEGLTEAEVLDWRVAEGDQVTVNQILLEVETAKAAVELPSPFAGRVVSLLAAPGDVVPVGEPIIRIEDGHDESTVAGSDDALDVADADSEPETGAPAGVSAGPEAGGASGSAQAGGAADSDQGQSADTAGRREAVLVGYGVKAAQIPSRRPRHSPHGVDHVEPGPPGEQARPVRQGGLELGRAVENRLGTRPARAKPPVRKLARDLQVDLAAVAPSGPDGTITHDDVQRAARATSGTGAQLASSRPPASSPTVGTRSVPGSQQVVPRTHVARMMAQAMTRSVTTAAHVTEWVDVDVTRMSELIAAARAREDYGGLSITPLTFAALGLVRAAQAYPAINSSLDETGENLTLHGGVHVGIAVDSPRGLIVPHIADAQALDLRGMADAMGRLVETARAGRSRPEDLRGSTLTITNVGVFGVDGGTPILNPGEVVILALGRVLARPWVVDGRIEARDVATLALSFDHRVVDGALGSRVLREVADFMADPARALALG
jgi:pyruvate dehydrogenase E2 component (dihydrolipoamide acetyltransferase)